ncbi:MAG: hypothetical protein NXH78_00645 [Hyphomonadaceae bacterium]|nr:hypothetical protein [Hyphomonadaceae bacterium]
MIRTLPIATLALLSACATQVPYEDRARALTLTWTLEPTQSKTVSVNASQGDVLLTWQASSKTSHTLDNGEALTAVTTPFGNLYCSFGADGTCYEDRDGNDRFDHQWTIKDAGMRTVSSLTARTPIKLTVERQFSGLSEDEVSVTYQRTAALVYDGPREGVLAEDGRTFQTMLGQLAFGWLDPAQPRSPSADSWRLIQLIPFAILSDTPVRTKVNELNLIYALENASIDGAIAVDLEAGHVEDYSIQQRLSFSVIPTEPSESNAETSAEIDTDMSAG